MGIIHAPQRKPEKEDFSQVTDLLLTGKCSESDPCFWECILSYQAGVTETRSLSSEEVNEITVRLGKGKYIGGCE